MKRLPAPGNNSSDSGETAVEVRVRPDRNPRFPNLNRGGTRGNKGGGRRPYSIIKHAQKLASKHKLLEFLAECAAGYPLAQPFQTEGGVVVDYVPARPAERKAAAQLVLAYGHGQPPEKVVVEGGTTSYVVHVPVAPDTVAEWQKMFQPVRRKA